MTDPPAQSIRDRNRASFNGACGHVYSWYMDRPRVSRPVGALLWGGDTRPFYYGLAAIRDAPDGALVIDAPCGSGIAFRDLAPSQRIRYVGLDISEAMLERARRRAESLGLEQVELVRGDVEHIPAEDRNVDLFMSWWGLHCVPDPEAAVREAARCLKPEGRLVGAMICKGGRLRQRLLVRPFSAAFGPIATPSDLEAWLERAGLVRQRVDISGPFAYFEASA